MIAKSFADGRKVGRKFGRTEGSFRIDPAVYPTPSAKGNGGFNFLQGAAPPPDPMMEAGGKPLPLVDTKSVYSWKPRMLRFEPQA
jgi:hypothetical protein